MSRLVIIHEELETTYTTVDEIVSITLTNIREIATSYSFQIRIATRNESYILTVSNADEIAVGEKYREVEGLVASVMGSKNNAQAFSFVDTIHFRERSY